MEGTESTTTPGAIAAKGGATPISMSVADFNTPDVNPVTDGEITNENQKQPNGAAAENQNVAAESNGITEAAALEYLGKMGVNTEGGLEKLKERLSGAPATNGVDLTDEQKQQAAVEKDTKLLQLYMSGGGTADQYVAMKNLLATKPEEISINQIRQELKADGFDDDEINAMLVERYYQTDPESLERTMDESDDEFQKRKDAFTKKATFGKKQIESRGTAIINKAQSFFTGLEEAMSIQESLSKNEAAFSSKVDEMASKLDKKITIQLGKVNDQELSPIEIEVTDEDIAEVTGILKDQNKRNQFFNKDNGLNLENIMPLMLRNKYLENAVKVGFLGGQDKAVAEFRKVFPSTSAKDIGVGGSGNSSATSGSRVAKAGKSTPMPVTLK